MLHTVEMNDESGVRTVSPSKPMLVGVECEVGVPEADNFPDVDPYP